MTVDRTERTGLTTVAEVRAINEARRARAAAIYAAAHPPIPLITLPAPKHRTT